MKKLFKIIFSRMSLVALAIIVQLIFSCSLPFLLNYLYPEQFGNIFVIVQTLINFVGFITMIAIINSKMIVEGKLIWVIIFLIYPLFGIIVYRMFVWKKAPRRHRKYFAEAWKQIETINEKNESDDSVLRKELGKYYGQYEYIYQTLNLRTYQNTKVKFLNTGEKFYQELLKELKQAKSYIFMEYFIIERGVMWNEILNVLKQKVKEGVDVRVMYDDFGTIFKLPSNYCKKLNEIGIKCVKFNSFVPIMSASHNNRDHRKITIIDGNVGFVGGINIADEYINIVQPYGYWKDSGIKISGEALKSLVMMFLQLYDVQNQQMEDFSSYVSNIKPVEAKGFVCPYGDGPKYFDGNEIAENVYLNIINQSEKYVWITTPYLIIDSKLTNALCSAAKRGVDVRIITPHTPDKKFVFMITRSSYKTLQEAGVKIFEYQTGFIHSKQILCDDEIGIIGTINLDYRSLLHHYECAVLMSGVECLKDIKSDFDDLFMVSKDMKDFKMNAFNRLICAILKAFTPML